MQFSRLLLVLAALFLAVYSLETRVFLERADSVSVPAGWTRASIVPLTQTTRKVNIIFAVKQRNLEELEATFWAVSDPKNAKYGQHLTLEEMTTLVGAEQSTIDTLVNWMTTAGLENIEVLQGRDFIRASASYATISKVFNVNYHYYRHESGITSEVCTGPYSLPETIGQYVDFVSGIVGFPEIHQPKETTETTDASSQNITPEVIRARYNVSDDTLCTNPNNTNAVAEFQAQYYSPSDLEEFWEKFVPFAPEQTIYEVIGTNNPDRPGVEASLDVEYIMGVAPGCKTYFYSQASFNFYSDLVTWITLLANETNPPFVHSVSYGSQGDYPSDSYIDRMNDEFQKLGARGLSILFASGDSGAGCERERSMSKMLDTEATCDCDFNPSFPATCQYVTSVGATRFLSGNSGPEAAVYLFKSGGGFSQDLPTPSYQQAAVTHYLNTVKDLPESCAFNASGRGTPDVAALGDEHFQVVNDGRTLSVGGTSASSPTFAAIVTLLNDIRLNNGESTLGFLNTWLYQISVTNPSALYDITIGDNTGTTCCTSGALSGFDCSAGWDPVTGLGTPNFEILKTLV